MLGTPEQDAFVASTTRAIATTVRRDGSPASSMIGYARIGDRLLFSSMADRVKGRTLARDPRIVLCVINPEQPMSYVSVEGSAQIHLDNPQELRDQIYAAWDNLDVPGWSARRESTLTLFAEPGRAIFEVTPTRISGQLI